MNDKIRPAHLQRRAAVYVRQSTLRQIVAHPESTRRQYGLRERAHHLGWPADAVEVFDEDLGQSGSEARRRVGFRRLCDQVSRGRVGAIFVLELSRLSRSSSDWHRLLDLCGIADVLLIDEQAIYDPADANDRLVLGIKGSMSEAEREWIQLRLRGARLSKARRGDYRLSPPIGYVWDRPTARLRIDPDGEVQGAVRLVFERFAIDRSAYGVVRYFVDHGLRLPAHSADGTTLRWTLPRPSRVLAMLHNPTCAGAYVFGRRTLRREIVDGAVVSKLSRTPADQWTIVHRDHHPAYLDWEVFMSNQRVLLDNRVDKGEANHGAPREGGALLQGLTLCGRCGHRMHVAYTGRVRRARYVCSATVQQGRAAHICWSVTAQGIDRVVIERMLGALTAEGLALALAVSTEATAQATTLDRQRLLQLERARYEARLAERRYKAVDPDNRTVARTLEKEWEAALAAVQQLERELDSVRVQAAHECTDEQRAQIEHLSQDLPRVWNSETLTNTQRKTIVRTLVREVCLVPGAEREAGTRVRVLWQTGAVTELEVGRQRPGRATAPATVAEIRKLVAASTPAGEIAKQLNRARLPTAQGHRWTPTLVHAYCRHHQIRWPQPMPTCRPQPLRRPDGAYSTRGVARRLRVTHATVLYWVKQGWLKGIEGGGQGHPRWYRLDAATLSRLREIRKSHTGPRGRVMK